MEFIPQKLFPVTMLPIFPVIPTKLIPQTKKAAGNIFGGGGTMVRRDHFGRWAFHSLCSLFSLWRLSFWISFSISCYFLVILSLMWFFLFFPLSLSRIFSSLSLSLSLFSLRALHPCCSPMLYSSHSWERGEGLDGTGIMLMVFPKRTKPTINHHSGELLSAVQPLPPSLSRYWIQMPTQDDTKMDYITDNRQHGYLV